jgi:DsbC/DsbD-like thiol-disulfide interchange protein
MGAPTDMKSRTAAKRMVTGRILHMKFRPIPFKLLFGVSLCSASFAQVPIQPVQWSGSTSPRTSVEQGSTIEINLSAEVQEGWHVYGLTQAPGGPTPLRVTLDEDGVVQIVSVKSVTASVKKHDPSFDLETEFYPGSFSLDIQTQVKQQAAAGDQSVPVSVRFQACNDRTCLPPKTIHLSVPIEVRRGT